MALIILLLVLIWSGQCQAQNPPTPAPTLVFPPGETLVYEVKWDPPPWMFFFPTMTAGQITLRCQKYFEYHESPAFLFSATAVSSGFLPKVTGLTVNDYFESIVEQKNFCSMRMYKKTQEGKRNFEMTQTFNPGQTTGHLVISDGSKNPPKVTRDEEIQGLPDCVQDLVSVVYHNRLRPMQVGGRYPVVISETGKIKTLEIVVRKRETLPTLLGTIPTLLIEGQSQPGMLFRDGGQVLIWVTDDQRKIPVRYEIKVKLGRVFGDLIKQEQTAKALP
jgi:hypothetical protein